MSSKVIVMLHAVKRYYKGIYNYPFLIYRAYCLGGQWIGDIAAKIEVLVAINKKYTAPLSGRIEPLRSALLII